MVVIAKTLQSQVENVTAQVKKLTSYAMPCVLTFPVTGGSQEYIAWLTGEVEGRKTA